MSDERIQRLTELARKAWPNDCPTIVREGAWIVSGNDVLLLVCDDVDRFEAALRTLAGEYASFVPAHRYMEVAAERDDERARAEAAEARLAELREFATRLRASNNCGGWCGSGFCESCRKDAVRREVGDDLLRALEQKP